MATFYVGKRPVLKGRNSNDAVHTWKGKKGTYSNWALFNTSHVLDGAPDNNVQPGAGSFPHGLQMSRWYRGLDTKFPMDKAGSGARLSGHRLQMPNRHYGLDSARALNNAGHTANRGKYYELHQVWEYSRVKEAMAGGGHGIRGVDASGTAASFGRFDPHDPDGRTSSVLAGASGTKPAADATGVYGHEHVNEWFGVPSAKAL